MKTNPNEAAYPQIELAHNHIEGPHKIVGGLTKREYFAAMALQGLLAYPGEGEFKKFTELSVMCADLLIEELNKKKEE